MELDGGQLNLYLLLLIPVEIDCVTAYITERGYNIIKRWPEEYINTPDVDAYR